MDIWCYDPEICEGHYCSRECDICPWQEKVFEKQEKEDAEHNDGTGIQNLIRPER